MNDLLKSQLSMILFIFCVLGIIFCITGCSTKKEIVRVDVPIPTNCDYNLTKAPEIKTETLQDLLNTLTELTLDSKKLRQDIQSIPCLNIY